MPIEKTIQSLREVLPRHRAELAHGTARHVALAQTTGPIELLVVLEPDGGLDDAQRGAVIAALVREHQDRGGQLWQTILVVTFEPALLRIRKRLRRPSREDLDQDVFVAFLRAIELGSSAKAEGYAPAAIVKYVERASLRGDRRVRRREWDTEPFEESEYDPHAHDGAERRAKDRVERLLAPFDPRLRDALLHTFGYGESLKEHVEECMPDLDEKERKRVYEQLRRARTEAIETLKRQKGPPVKT